MITIQVFDIKTVDRNTLAFDTPNCEVYSLLWRKKAAESSEKEAVLEPVSKTSDKISSTETGLKSVGRPKMN